MLYIRKELNILKKKQTNKKNVSENLIKKVINNNKRKQ